MKLLIIVLSLVGFISCKGTINFSTVGEEVPVDNSIQFLDPNWTFDTSFGTAGRRKILVQEDDKIIIHSAAEAVRFSSEGIVDTTFATAGVHTFSFSANAVAIASDGKYVFNGTNATKIRVEKLSTSGASLGIFSPLNALHTVIYGIALDSSDNIINVGLRNLHATGSWAGPYIGMISRVNFDGTLDTSFGPGAQGWLTYSRAGDAASNYADTKSAVALADGSIVASGVFDDNPKDMFLVKVTAAGTVDNAFGVDGNGFVAGGYSGSTNNKHHQGWDLKLLENGKLLAVGNSNNQGKIAKYFSDGTLDTAFGTAGVFSIDYDAISDVVSSLGIHADGTIIACGFSDGGYYVAKVE